MPYLDDKQLLDTLPEKKVTCSASDGGGAAPASASALEALKMCGTVNVLFFMA
jgi:hypothetical protein